MQQSGHGLILGKFLPPHAGHQHLIHFAQRFVERLTVLVCTLDREPIPGNLRYAWMRELFPEVRLVHIDDDALPQEPAEHPQFWEIWREVVQRGAGERIDWIFASEDYGHRLAQEVGARYCPVDPARGAVPISGSAIRHQPMRHWEMIPSCVRPYFLKRICLFGPESTGKSVLAQQLAGHFATVHVPEFARSWLDPRGGVCTPEDIPIIARGQVAAEESLARQANRLLFCDTDLLLTTVWSDVLFGACPEEVRAAAAARHYDLYLVLDIDLPWTDDSQRFLPHRRQEFLNRCLAVLESTRRPFTIVRGTGGDRLAAACRVVQSLLDE